LKPILFAVRVDALEEPHGLVSESSFPYPSSILQSVFSASPSQGA